ncbi:peptidylprolyl isomerase [Mesobacillus zeae]|uniref:peptidylprolyl isomerase n=1 Tax=Mesobacillus zeae TaxID=1917180 RepID=A0A398BJ21_9BACI|nr:peptidylprolyl isomerase [Mesobacillus zeae]
MGKKKLWLIIAGLAAVNLVTVLFLFTGMAGGRETVAEVGGEPIRKQELLEELEVRYGDETLKDLVDREVIKETADKYGIHVPENEVERELTMYKAMYAVPGLNGNELEQQVRQNILLEELAARDAVIPEKDMKKFYKENKKMFDIPESYHLSQIIHKTRKEAEQTVDELKGGSGFPALALERSEDEFSAAQGGDIGFVNSQDGRTNKAVMKEAKRMKLETWSDPVKIKNGYAVIYLHEKIKGKKYTFKEAKSQIRRKLALEELDAPISARRFWGEAKAELLYDSSERN